MKRLIVTFVICAVVSTLFSQTVNTISNSWKHMPDSYIGFPFDIVLNDHLQCFASEQQWVARLSVYFVNDRYFSERNLGNLFAKISALSPAGKELRIIAVSDPVMAAWLVEPRLVSSHPQRDPTFEAGVSMLNSDGQSIAEFYRIGENEGFWYKKSNRKEKGRLIIMRGRDPFHGDEISFSFQIASNLLFPDSTGVECDLRDISVLVRACDFSETNTIKLLSWLSSRFPIPTSLRIWIKTDREILYQQFMGQCDAFSLLSWRLRESVGLPPCPVSRIPQEVNGHAYYSRLSSRTICHFYGNGSSTPKELNIPQRPK